MHFEGLGTEEVGIPRVEGLAEDRIDYFGVTSEIECNKFISMSNCRRASVPTSQISSQTYLISEL